MAELASEKSRHKERSAFGNLQEGTEEYQVPFAWRARGGTLLRMDWRMVQTPR